MENINSKIRDCYANFIRVMSSEKPYSSSCDRNRDPILKVLQELIRDKHKSLLEIGSGTGQHAVYLSKHFPQLNWFCSDTADKLAGISMWIDDSNSNIKDPLEFEIMKDEFPKGSYDLLFTANTFHIMSWKHVQHLINLSGKALEPEALFLIYGPFNYDDNNTSESNENFDQWLKDRDPNSGIRNFEDLVEEMNENSFEFKKDFAMPANNRFLVFEKH